MNNKEFKKKNNLFRKEIERLEKRVQELEDSYHTKRSTVFSVAKFQELLVYRDCITHLKADIEVYQSLSQLSEIYCEQYFRYMRESFSTTNFVTIPADIGSEKVVYIAVKRELYRITLPFLSKETKATIKKLFGSLLP